MSLISNIGAYTYTDKISAITVAPTPFNNTGNYYNLVYIGTSNGKIYLYNENTDTTSMTSIVPIGYTGTLSGEITGLTVDPTGKYLFINAPYDNHCLRLSLISIPFDGTSRTITVPVDRDIYRFGDNTGNIVVDSQGVVYIVTGGGSSISTMERYGNSFVNLLFLNQYPVLNFKGIALSANEQRIYALDLRFGSIYYYDFLSNQPTFTILSAIGSYSGLRSIAVSGNNVFYCQTNAVYARNSYFDTITRVVGSGLSGYVPTTNPQDFTLSGANAVSTSTAGDIYLSSSNALGYSTLYKVTFSLPDRNGYQAPPSRQQLPILQPYPTTSCKRIVEPFSPRLRFGWGLTNTKKPPILDVFKSPLCCPPPIVNCPVTPFYCSPEPPPIYPPQPVAPIFPITVPTRQFGDCMVSTGFRDFINLDSNVVRSISLTFISQNSLVEPALGPLGEVYYTAEDGVLFKVYNGQISKIFSTGSSNKLAGPVVSTTGAVVVTTDLGQLYRLDSNASVFQFFPIRLGQQIGGSPACITNGAFDYIVACYGNTIAAYQASNAGGVWSATTQGSGELFRTSVATDGVNIFAGTTNGQVYCFVGETGKLNWVYSIPGATTAPFTPYVNAFSIGIAVPNDSNLYILSNTTVRAQAYDIKVTLSGLKIASPPIISTDSQGGVWAHIINASGRLYGFGGIVASTSGFGYRYLWSNAPCGDVPSSYQTPVLDSIGNIYISTLSGTVNQYQAYYTTNSRQDYTSRLVLNGKTQSSFSQLPIQVSATPLITSQNTMYVFSRYTGTNSNYIYTISGALVQAILPSDTTEICAAGSYTSPVVTIYNTDDTPFETTLVNAGGVDACVIKYTALGYVKWAAHFSRLRADSGISTTIDSTGNIYLIGTTGGGITGVVSTAYNADGTPSGVTLTSVNNLNAGFIVKYSSDGTALWATQFIPIVGRSTGNSITTDSFGNVYSVGNYSLGTLTIFNADKTVSPITLANSDATDACIIKYNSSGTAQWAARATGTIDTNISVSAIRLDSTGNNLYIVGNFLSRTLTIYNADNTVFAKTLENSGNTEGFIIKYNSAGFAQWATKIGGSLDDIININSVVIDSTGNVYIVGNFLSRTLIIYNADNTVFVKTLENSGIAEGCIIKYNSAGFAQWAAQIGGTGSENIYSIAIDSQGNIYVGGTYTSSVLIIYNQDGTPSGLTLQNTGGDGGFIIKYNSGGIAQWATRIGGTGDTNFNLRSIALDSAGNNLYVVGSYITSTVAIFNADKSVFPNTLTRSGTRDSCTIKYDTIGKAQWAARTGGTGGRCTLVSVGTY